MVWLEYNHLRPLSKDVNRVPAQLGLVPVPDLLIQWVSRPAGKTLRIGHSEVNLAMTAWATMSFGVGYLHRFRGT